jgi:flagellin
MTVAIRNANDGVSLAQTAEGGLSKISDSLQRMRELAVQSANATNTTSDRAALADEFKELQSEISRVVDSTRFNGQQVLKGTNTFTFQVGADNKTEDKVDIKVSDMSDGDLKTAFTPTDTEIDSGATKAGLAIEGIDKALTAVNTERSKMGASANRFESIIGSLQVNVENQSAARGRIIDADFAVETANFTRSQILQQAGNAMLAQANSAPQQVLSLLRF